MGNKQNNNSVGIVEPKTIEIKKVLSLIVVKFWTTFL